MKTLSDALEIIKKNNNRITIDVCNYFEGDCDNNCKGCPIKAFKNEKHVEYYCGEHSDKALINIISIEVRKEKLKKLLSK